MYTDEDIRSNRNSMQDIDGNNLHSSDEYNLTPHEASKSLTFIYANINSWSANAQNTLLDSSVHADILFMVETHQQSGTQIKADLRQNGRRAFLNHAAPSAKSALGSHGGEAIAPLSHLNIRPVDQELLKEISKVTAEPLRWVVAVLLRKALPIMVGNVYMWDSEDLSDRNINILRQLYIVKQVIQLPCFIIGDFNMTPETLRSSVWLDALQVETLVADTCTTLNTTVKVIDYAICSPEIQHLFKLNVHDETSFSPHYSLQVNVLASPRTIIGNVLKIPSPALRSSSRSLG